MAKCDCKSPGCLHKKPITHLHLHTGYSLLDGAAHIDSYMKLAKDYEHPAMTILDHGNMSGTFEFYQKCKANGIKPILGMEAYVNDTLDMDKNDENYEGKDTHQSILIKNKTGFINLNKLTYLSFTEGYYRRGGITTEWLIANKEGLLITTSCCASKLATLVATGNEAEAEARLKLLMREFGDDLVAELQFNEYEPQVKYNLFILKMIKKYSLMPILTGDVHYALKDEARLQDVLMAINQHRSVTDEKAFKLSTRHLYYASADDFHMMNKKFGFNYPESFVNMCLENTNKVAEKCNFNFETDVEKYPKYEPTKQVSDYYKTTDTKEIITKYAHAKLTQKLEIYKKNGIVKVDDAVEKKYRDRLDYELKVIEDKKMLDYFMVVWELIKFCETNDIATGVGRGCFVPGSRVRMFDGMYCPIDLIKIGDEIIDSFNKKQTVTNILEYDVEEDLIELEFQNGKKITCTQNHEFLTSNRGWVEAKNINEEDEIVEVVKNEVPLLNPE